MSSRSFRERALPRSFVAAHPFASREIDPWIARLRGPLATLTLAVFLEVLSHSGLTVPHVDSFLILLVAYVAFVDGPLAGLLSGSLAVGYYSYSVSDYGRGLHTAVLPWEEMVIVGSSIMVLAGLVGVLRIQLEGARAQERATRGRLVEVLEGLTSGFLLVEPGGIIEYSNGRAPELLDVPGATALRGDFWPVVDSALGPDAVDRLRRSLAGGQFATFEVQHLRTGGWLDIQAHPITAGLAVFITDSTQRRKSREQGQALRRMQAITGLSGGIAHRFNNLLTAIRGYGELAVASSGPDHPARPHLDRIGEAAQAATELVQQLQSYSRQRVLRPASLSISEMVAALESELRGRLGREQELRLEPSGDPLPVHVDREALKQMMLGLADHAAATMGPAGRLTLRVRPVHLQETEFRENYAVPAGVYAVLEIADDGPGLDGETRERIFEPFHRMDDADSPTGGLGLAAVYGAVKQSGGFIDANGAPDGGTIFRVWLPIAADHPPTAPPPAVAGRSGAATVATILIAEDDESVLDLATRVLRSAGHTVIPTGDAERALAAAAAAAHPGPIDMLLTDVVMPGRGGRELAREMVLERPEIALLYMSGYTDERAIRSGIARGVLEADVDFLPKPFTPSVLVEKVAEVLAARRAAAMV